jgi:transcriptional regulator with XRE-family HTH domain
MDEQGEISASSGEDGKKRAGTPNQALKRARERKGWTQQVLADKLGTVPLTINRWEQGKAFPGPFNRARLCEVFESTADELGLVKEVPPEEQDATEEQPPEALPHPVPPPVMKSSNLRGVLLIGIGLGLLIGMSLFFLLPRQPSPHVATQPTVASHLAIATPPGVLVIDDSLRSANTQGKWHTGKHCMFKDQQYTMQSVGMNYCLAEGRQFTNVVYQIDMEIQRGQRAGIIFRADANSDMYYFYLTVDGHYELLAVSHSSHTVLKKGYSTAIRQGLNRFNTLTVAAKGSAIIVSINGQQVEQAQDSAYTMGYVGICLGSSEYDPSESAITFAAYRNAKVWILD